MPHASGAPGGLASRAEPPRDLSALGFSGHFEELFAHLAEKGFVPGRVSRVDRGQPLVLTETGPLRAEPAAHLRDLGDARIVVGDWVALARPEGHDLAIVEAIIPRVSAFSRKDPGEQGIEQVVVANVDVAFVVQALSPGPNIARLERELVLAWESGARPVVVLTKSDLATDVQTARAEVAAVALGVETLVTCAITGEGVDAITACLGRGKSGAFFGASGVGKSTLVNRLVGDEVQQTAAVRETDGKGRHTTVAREMFFLADGSILIDTPGMRALALLSGGEGIAAAFPEVEQLAELCRFADCRHVREPGCALREAVEDGRLSERRLASYRALKDEAAHVETRHDGRRSRPRRDGRGG